MYDVISGKAPKPFSVTQQADQLEMLRQFLELTGGVQCQRESVLHGIPVPLSVRTSRGNYAIGTYPVQQNRKMIKHSLDGLPSHQVRIFSDYELRHRLPFIAQTLM